MTSPQPLVKSRSLLMLLMLLSTANLISAATYLWDREVGTPYWNHTGNWSPNSYPGTLDDVTIGGSPFVTSYDTTFVPEVTGSSFDQIGSLALVTIPGVSHPARVRTNGYELIVNGDTVLTGAGSVLIVDELSNGGADSDSFDTNTLTTDTATVVSIQGGIVEVDGGAPTNPTAPYPLLQNGGVISGWGTIDLVNSASSTTPIIFNNGYLGRPGALATSSPTSGVGDVYPLAINVLDTAGNHDATATIDLDGAENGIVVITTDTSLHINGRLEDAFSTTMNFRAGTTLTMRYPWELDDGGEINVENPVTDWEDRARISEAAFTAGNGSTINIDSGLLHIDAVSFTVNAGATIDMDENTVLVLDSPTTIESPESLVLDDREPRLYIEEPATIGSGSGYFNWDGAYNDAETYLRTADLHIDVESIGPPGSPDVFHGLIDSLSGSIEVHVADGEWELAGRLRLWNPGPVWSQLSGSDVLVTGEVEIESDFGGGSSIIADEVVFADSSSVLVLPNSILHLPAASTRISGGTWTGSGTVVLRSNVTTVDADTIVTMPLGIFDLDGFSAGAVIRLDRKLTLQVWAIDSYGENEIEDSITINPDGRLDVQFTYAAHSYVIAETLDLNAHTGMLASTQLDGSDVELRGTTNVNGNSIAAARVTITGVADIRSSSAFDLRGGTLGNPNRIENGVVNGHGELRSNNNHALTGYGTINADVRFGGNSELRAADATLTINGTIHEANIIGTASADAILEVTNDWNTNVAAGALVLEGGQVVGSEITNGGRTRGFGYIRTLGYVNNNSLSSTGDSLLVIDTVNAADLDGVSSAPAIPVVNAVEGDLWVTGALNDDFDAELNVGAGRYVRFGAGWRLQSAAGGGVLNMMGGPDIATAAHVYGGPQNLAGTVNVEREAFFVARTTFETGAVINIPTGDDALRLFEDSHVQSGAQFHGLGTLVNTTPMEIVLEDGAVVGVKIFNAGLLRIGSSIGTARVARYEQTRLGTLELEIDGTVPGTQYDQLWVTGDVDISTSHVDPPGSALVIPVNENGGSYVDPAAPGDCDAFYLISSNTLSGMFGDVVYDGTSLTPSFVGTDFFRSYVGEGLFRIVQYDDAGVTFVNYRALPGDANGDLVVDVLDFNHWNTNKFSAGTTWTTADFNGDGMTDVLDFNIWNTNKFTSAADVSLVPEPTALGIVICALFGLGHIFRRR